MLWYPAFSITDDLHDFFPSLDQVGDSYFYRWVTLGRVYAEDMWDYDVFADMAGYTDPVLIVHGSADAVVDIAYSERAAQTYPDAELVTIDGAGHGFTGSDWEQAVSADVDYLRRVGILPG
ncbi:alpha/beta hydrolase family protein [Actinomyces ruminis]|uniref:alpha/beta hydrolase family protein n=1 Tax=Actinomyces ruminis TaxID=1937003 RepID=UPI00211E3621|nr:alpha/beta hydrolase [Actinomyces ruminis]